MKKTNEEKILQQERKMLTKYCRSHEREEYKIKENNNSTTKIRCVYQRLDIENMKKQKKSAMKIQHKTILLSLIYKLCKYTCYCINCAFIYIHSQIVIWLFGIVASCFSCLHLFVHILILLRLFRFKILFIYFSFFFLCRLLSNKYIKPSG